MPRGRPTYFDQIIRCYEDMDEDVKHFFKVIRALAALAGGSAPPQTSDLDGEVGPSPDAKDLLSGFDVSRRDIMELMLAYVFSRIERAHMILLYLVACNYLCADTEVADRAVNHSHFNRGDVEDLMYRIFGSYPSRSGEKFDLEKAEKARDKLMHGKNVGDREIVDAICSVLRYAVNVKGWVEARDDIGQSSARLNPFVADLRSAMAGRVDRLDKRRSRFILKGCGFQLQ